MALPYRLDDVTGGEAETFLPPRGRLASDRRNPAFFHHHLGPWALCFRFAGLGCLLGRAEADRRDRRSSRGPRWAMRQESSLEGGWGPVSPWAWARSRRRQKNKRPSTVLFSW